MVVFLALGEFAMASLPEIDIRGTSGVTVVFAVALAAITVAIFKWRRMT